MLLAVWVRDVSVHYLAEAMYSHIPSPNLNFILPAKLRSIPQTERRKTGLRGYSPQSGTLIHWEYKHGELGYRGNLHRIRLLFHAEKFE